MKANWHGGFGPEISRKMMNLKNIYKLSICYKMVTTFGELKTRVVVTCDSYVQYLVIRKYSK